ncbi:MULTISPECIES: potassium transporter TrkG [unclassified Leeuwenhoekiella]|uniref:potassium transporter TrkG n=1 Tax=unclassified Leeuwenhoekiella TaxID=2615029 RepID=UPI0025B95691|nr:MULTISPECIES: potassium transporter TrkG [unclassified Leeuwenhoekiella]
MGNDFTLAYSLFEAASTKGTVGLSKGITDLGMSPVLNTIYILQMWSGRIEIIPVLVRILFLWN